MSGFVSKPLVRYARAHLKVLGVQNTMRDVCSSGASSVQLTYNFAQWVSFQSSSHFEQNCAYYSVENPVNINLVTILAWDRISQNLSYGIFDKSGDIMNLGPSRPHRRNLTSHGLIYMGGEEQGISIKNISITGVLAELHSQGEGHDIKGIFDKLLISTVIDLYLPELRLAGEAEVIRVDLKEDHILIALEFKNVTYEVDNLLYKRKAYRKSMPGPGLILLGGKYHEFDAVNVSVEGLMVRLDEKITVEEGMITVFEFKRLNLSGEIRVIWVDPIADSGTLIGLQYVHMEKVDVKGVPRFNLSSNTVKD